MNNLTNGQAIARDDSAPSDTAKLAMFRLVEDGVPWGVRFIIMEHPSNKQLAYVDLAAAKVQAMVNVDLPRLLLPEESK